MQDVLIHIGVSLFLTQCVLYKWHSKCSWFNLHIH